LTPYIGVRSFDFNSVNSLGSVHDRFLDLWKTEVHAISDCNRRGKRREILQYALGSSRLWYSADDWPRAVVMEVRFRARRDVCSELAQKSVSGIIHKKIA